MRARACKRMPAPKSGARQHGGYRLGWVAGTRCRSAGGVKELGASERASGGYNGQQGWACKMATARAGARKGSKRFNAQWQGCNRCATLAVVAALRPGVLPRDGGRVGGLLPSIQGVKVHRHLVGLHADRHKACGRRGRGRHRRAARCRHWRACVVAARKNVLGTSGSSQLMATQPSTGSHACEGGAMLAGPASRRT